MFMLIISLAGILLVVNHLDLRRDPVYLRLFDLAAALINVPLMLFGVLLLVMPEAELAGLLTADFAFIINYRAGGWVALAVGGWGVLAGLPLARRLLARWLPISPDSPVHTLALLFVGYMAGNTLLTLTQGGLADLAATAAPAAPVELLAQFLLFIMVGVLGVGWGVRRNNRATLARLGLVRPSRAQLLAGIRWTAALVALQWLVGIGWALSNPEQSELLDSISGALYANLDTVGEWLFLAVGTGLSEELLFRGALQPVLGLKFTAVFFAILHVQYGITPVTLAVFLIGMALGHIRRRYNTTTAVFVHAGYNFILGLMALLAAYLEPLVN